MEPKRNENPRAKASGGTEWKFKILKRDPRQLSGSWRLASVDEVKDLEKETRERILDSEDSARLLDGFIYEGAVKIKYEPHNFDHMLAIKMEEEKSRPSGDSFPEELYSGIELTPEKRKTALFLSCKDKNTEVIYWVLKNLEGKSNKDDKFDRLMQSLKKTLSGDRTVLHYAADQPNPDPYGQKIAKLLWNDFKSGKEIVKAQDNKERTALHYAADHGQIDLCQFFIQECELRIDDKDRKGENVLHIAVDRNKTDLVVKLFEWDKVSTAISSPLHEAITPADRKGRTPLHKAVANGNLQIVKILVDGLGEEELRLKYVRQVDMYGETAIHDAARKGHTEVVKYLLQKGSRPLCDRNADGTTALHYAVQVQDEQNAKELIDLLLTGEMKYKVSNEEKYLLLWAFATGVGTAADSTRSPTIRKYLEKKISDLEKETPHLKETELLLLMVKNGYLNMALELVNRGANVEEIRDLQKKAAFKDHLQQKRVKMFLDYIDKTPERGTDQPATEDSLGRSAFAEGLASLFLNPFVKSPVTVGIFGNWGMGKSSIMQQTENLLLKEAAQLAFPDLLEVNTRSKRLEMPQNCHYKKLRLAITIVMKGEEGLVDLLNNYQEKNEKVYRFLALMNRRQLFATTCNISDSRSKKHPLANIPSILTVRYNAWHYKNDLEAWAGLAVRITEVIEQNMTTAQRIRVSCKYAWKEHEAEIWLQLLLPCLLALVSAGLVAWVAWSVLNRSNINEIESLKYGSIPLTIVVIVWTVVRQLISVIKPISDQVMRYVRSNDHKGHLGYQQKVIDDIEYLRKEIGEEPCWVWKFLAWPWNWLHLRLCGDTIEGTWIPKTHSASRDDLRIIVFVDDLDRCEDKVILQVLSAVNLVLAACKINVVLGVDKKMLAGAIAKKFENCKEENVEDLAENYMSKIIQLPLALPDPDHTVTATFLKQQMGPALKWTDEPQSSAGAAGPVVVEEGNRQSRTRSLGGFFSNIWQLSGDTEGGQQGGNPHQFPTRKLGGFLSNIWQLFYPCPGLPGGVQKDMEGGQQGGAPGPVVVNEGNHQSLTRRLGGFFSNIWQLFYPCPRLSGVQKDMEGGQQGGARDHEVHVGNRQEKRSKNVTLMQSYMPNLSKEEQQALLVLEDKATDTRRLPREWKRFLTYHHLAWNILSKKDEIKTLPGWQVQLVVWIFCCFQWKHRINDILKDWQSIVYIEPQTKEINEDEGPSLHSIINHYMGNNCSLDKKADWTELSDTLEKYDVSMKAIQCFQDFRLHCEVGRLRWGYKLKETGVPLESSPSRDSFRSSQSHRSTSIRGSTKREGTSSNNDQEMPQEESESEGENE